MSAPAVTNASLLASATVRPASTAAMTGSSPAQPTIAAITHSASPAAASINASAPVAARQFVPDRASRSSPSLDSSAITASLALGAGRLGQEAAWWPRQCKDFEPVRMALDRQRDVYDRTVVA